MSHTLKASFNAGELDPLMDARVNVEKYESGCRKLENFVIQPHGPVTRRPGLEYVGRCLDTDVASRLIEFNYSATTRFLIEMADGVFRIWSDGELVPTGTISHPYATSEFFEVQAKQVNDVVFFAHPDHHPLKLSRITDTNWTCETLPLSYPPLLDEYVETETVATPIVTQLHGQPLRHAEEFTIGISPSDALRWAEVTASGVADSAWLEVEWDPGITPTTAGTLTLELQNLAGDWVSGGSITVSSTSTAAAKFQLAFQPTSPDTSVLVRRRTWTGAAWGAWATLATVTLMLDAGYTAATMPAIKLRFAPGPDTRNYGSNLNTALITWITSATGPLTNTFTGSEGRVFSADVLDMNPFVSVASLGFKIGVPVVAGRKFATLQVRNGSAWVTLQRLNLYYPPGSSGGSTIYYGGRLRISGANLLWETGEPGYEYTTLTSVASTETGPWTLRLLTEEVTTNAASIAVKNALSGSIAVVQEITLERTTSGPDDAGSGGVTVPAGKWLFYADIPEDITVPSGATLTLQKQVGTVWQKVQSWTVEAGTRIEYDRTADGLELATPTVYRSLYSSTPTLSVNASAVFESLTYPVSAAKRLAVSHTSGTGRTMTASEDVFLSGHVGSYWQIAHRRDLALTEIVGKVGTFSPSKLVSDSLRVVGKWELTSYGTWKGKVYLERRTPSNSWEILRVWNGNYDRNIAANNEVDTDADLRIRVSVDMVGKAASGAAVPRFLLEASDARTYGLVKVTAVTDARTATVDVIRVLGSTEQTTLWAEGAWSEVRGYPAALGLHQQRLWFGGTLHQPQTLWASVSGDFDNFRRSTQDDGSLAITLAAESSNAIQWISSAPGALLVGTGGDEWAIKSGNEGPITSVAVKAEVQSSYSSGYIAARRANDVTLFVQRDMRRVRQMTYAQGQEGFIASDLTVLASHVTAGGIRQIAFQQSPQAIVWAVTNDGQLIGMTFEKDQNVFGWHRHTTLGTVESVAVLHGTPSDEVHVCVRRMIDGAEMRTIEKMVFRAAADAVHLDGAVTSLSDLGHLEGVAVDVVKDGAYEGRFTVTGGAVPVTGDNLLIGIPYTSVIQPMKQELQLQDGTAQDRKFKLNGATVRVHESHGGKVTANLADSRLSWSQLQVPAPSNDAPPVLQSRDYRVNLESRHDASVNVAVATDTPFAFTLVSLVMNFDVYGHGQ